MSRMPLIQTEAWHQHADQHGVYSAAHCCICGRRVKPGATRVRTVRTNDGDWWVKPVADASLPDETHMGEAVLPVGPECFRNHPEWVVAVVQPDTKGDS